MKRFFALLLTLSLGFGHLFADDTARGASAWAKPEIQKGLAMGIIDPALNSAYRSKISRQDFCRLMVGVYLKENGYRDIDDLLKRGVPQAQEHRFEDLDYKTPDYKYVLAAHALGLVNGVSDTRFAPQNGITREQAAKIFANFYTKLAQDRGLYRSFQYEYREYRDDGAISSWAKKEVYFLGALKVMEGVGSNRFAPQASYSREQSFVTALRVYEAYQNLQASESLKAKTKAQEAAPSSEEAKKKPAEFEKAAAYKAEVLRLCNVERERAGLKPLIECHKYNDYADLRAREIKELFDHTRPDGSDCASGMNPDYSYVGENIAAGQLDPQEVVRDWMNSEGHRRNILKPEFEELSVGIHEDANSKYGLHWVQIFYTPLR